jgi:cytidylate kinase
VTISRQSGSGGHAVAEALAGYLQSRTPDKCPWTVFDRNLVEKVLEDHQLPKQIARFMPEDRHSEIQDVLDDMLGLHPSCWSLVDKTAETILSLAELGNVIVLGRGGNIITSRLEYVFHVRLIGSLERRVGYIQRSRRVEKNAAAEFVHNEDEGRRRYLKKYFHKDIEDPLHYDLVINTDRISHNEVARTIANIMLPG